ncbi:MAG: hypothetical protein F6K58_17115 [Symploca sp. SIO2E9]|nr:hypothetical protein [Symploca sp. SIO2E9]
MRRKNPLEAKKRAKITAILPNTEKASIRKISFAGLIKLLCKNKGRGFIRLKEIYSSTQ